MYIIARASNGKSATASFSVDGTSAYNSGKTAGANTLAISPATAQTLDYGKTVTITATTENSSGQKVTKSVDVTAPADRYGTGYNAGYADGKDAYSPTSITRTGYSTADKTVTVKAANSHQDLLTGQVISASEIYDAGRSAGYSNASPSSVERVATYDSASTAYNVTVKVKSADGTTKDFALVSISAKAAYDAGYAAGYQAAKDATTVTGGITSIVNTAQNYYQATGWASARVDGEQVDYTTFSKAQSFG